jgi:beta-RFAP synthase
MTRVVAPSRLHFGLLSVPVEGLPRRFGGVGLMIDEPGVAVRVEPAPAWGASGPCAERALDYAQAAFPGEPLHVVVERCPPEHVGLGVGTQLGLAVARAVAAVRGRPDPGAVALARAVGRGERSGIGVHGFARGGLIVEGGKRDADAPSVLLAHYDFPETWRVLLARPAASAAPWTGPRERQAFARARRADAMLALTERMCRLLVLGLLPALLERDCDALGDALHEYNRLAGRMFADDQGGDYASPDVSELIATIRGLGVRGAGQSSWGPTVFAICPDTDAASRLRAELGKCGQQLDVTVTTASKNGAAIS